MHSDTAFKVAEMLFERKAGFISDHLAAKGGFFIDYLLAVWQLPLQAISQKSYSELLRVHVVIVRRLLATVNGKEWYKNEGF